MSNTSGQSANGRRAAVSKAKLHRNLRIITVCMFIIVPVLFFMIYGIAAFAGNISGKKKASDSDILNTSVQAEAAAVKNEAPTAAGGIEEDAQQVKADAEKPAEAPEEEIFDADTAYETDDETGNKTKNGKGFVGLYLLEDGTPYTMLGNDGKALTNYPRGTAGGLFTGVHSENYPEMIEINIESGKALVPAGDTFKIDGAKVLPIGTISQFTNSGGGGSACGAAVLTMLFGGRLEDLVDYCDANGYSDQGNLNSAFGGMTVTAMQQVALNYFGRQLVNVYSSDKIPSDVIKEIIDGGAPVVILVRLSYSGDVGNSGDSHFVLVNGYIENDGILDFVYADSYHYSDGEIPLGHISADRLNAAVTDQYDEPNTIAYVVD